MTRRVLLDIRANQRTGISRYGCELAAALTAGAADHADLCFTVLADPGQRARLGPAAHGPELLLAPTADRFVRRSDWVRELTARLRPALYVTTHYTVDRHLRTPFMHTVHDLTRLQFPQHAYTKESVELHYGVGEWEVILGELRTLRAWDDGQGPEFLRYFRALNRYQAVRARAVLTVSRTTGGQLTDLLDVPDRRIHLVPGAVNPALFTPQPPSRAAAVARRYGVTRPYCLYVGLVGPTKRFPWLLDVLLRRRVIDRRRPLVVVGGHAEQHPRVRELRAEGRLSDAVVFCGQVSDGALAALYSGARALLVPSLGEGFHLPTAEALACGTEVIAADIPALRETAGPHAHFFAPHDEAELATRCAQAYAGELPPRRDGYTAPRWSTSAEQLVRAVRVALAEV